MSSYYLLIFLKFPCPTLVRVDFCQDWFLIASQSQQSSEICTSLISSLWLNSFRWYLQQQHLLFKFWRIIKTNNNKLWYFGEFLCQTTTQKEIIHALDWAFNSIANDTWNKYCLYLYRINSFNIWIKTYLHKWASVWLFQRSSFSYVSPQLLFCPALLSPNSFVLSCCIFLIFPSHHLYSTPSHKTNPYGSLLVFWLLWVFQFKHPYLHAKYWCPQKKENL